MKALIQNNKVIDIQEIEFEVHETLSWVDCDNSVQIGWTYDGTNFETNIPTITTEQKLTNLRNARDSLLANTDWWVLPDRTATDEQLAYRQALRDITNTYTSLDDVVWPTRPA